MPLPDKLSDHYGIDPEAYWAPTHVTPRPTAFSSEIQRYQTLRPGPLLERRALDIGAGIGHTMAALRRAGFDVYGIEPSREFEEKARELYSFETGRLVAAQVENATFDAASFDFITFGAVLEHLPDPGAALQRAFQWLRPHGIVHVEVPSTRWLVGRFLNGYFRAIGTDYVTNTSPMHAPFHLYEFSRRSFERTAERLGYRIEALDVITGGTPFPKPIDAILRVAMTLTRSGMQLSIWMAR